MGGIGASLRQMLTFARPWERVVLGVVLFAVATSLGSYVLAALGLVIVGVTVLGMVRARKEAGAGTGASDTGTETATDAATDTATGTGAETGSGTGSELGEP